MALGVDIGELGFSPTSAPARPGDDSLPGAEALVVGSPLARVLYEVWSGRSVTVVPSPPGAGKTTLVVGLIEQFVSGEFGSIHVIAPTRRGVLDIAERTGRVIGLDASGRPRVKVSMDLKGAEQVSRFVATNGTKSLAIRPVVTFSTCASAQGVQPDVDLLIVDEAYQQTFNDVGRAAERAEQIVLVGDPGQIPAIVTANTQAWEGRRAAPHMRAPDVFIQDEDVFTMSLPATYRLGARTTQAIAALYDFPFHSERPDRFVRESGQRSAEIVPVRLDFQTEADLTALQAIAARAIELLDADYVELDDDGHEQVRAMTPSDIAIVVARRAQYASLRAMLAAHGKDGRSIQIGTADKMQGGQWPAVIAVDPLSGSNDADGFRTHTGRLCVMASRHMAHLTWVHDGTWAAKLTALGPRHEDASKGLAVRRALVGR